jgi:tetratricopeptide (TPR) repeat protein
MADVLAAAGDMAGADVLIDQVLAAEPQHVGARDERATILEASGRWDEALVIRTQLVDEHPYDVNYRLQRAETNDSAERFEASLLDAEAVLAEQPDNLWALSVQISALHYLDRDEAALASTRRYIGLSTETYTNNNILCLVAPDAGLLEEGMRACHAALAEAETGAQRASTLRRLGLAHETAGEIDQAIRRYQEVVATPDARDDTRALAARYLARLGAPQS